MLAVFFSFHLWSRQGMSIQGVDPYSNVSAFLFEHSFLRQGRSLKYYIIIGTVRTRFVVVYIPM